MNFSELVYWSNKTYGKALILSNPIPKTKRLKFVFVCLFTPFTNWLIPFILMDSIIVRYGG